jgi:protein gp37
MQKTNIEWCDYTWNPITGCSPASEGCANCYAAAIAKRFKKPWGTPVFHPEKLAEPMRLRKPSRIFVNSVSDLFHEGGSWAWVDKILSVVAACPQHTFIVLTKRADRMGRYFRSLYTTKMAATRLGAAMSFLNLGDDKYGSVINSIEGRFGPNDSVGWPMRNLWLGVSVENQARADERIPLLLQTPAAVRFISVEPMLEEVSLRNYYREEGSGCYSTHLDYLDWVICGPESGPKARPFKLDWARSLRDQCAAAAVPFFFKGVAAKGGGKDYLLDGARHFNWPEAKAGK